MSSTLASLILALAATSTGGLFDRTVAVVPANGPGQAPAGHAHGGHELLPPGGRILPPGPGAGWGFPNGNPDGYGWVDYGTFLPLGANRTPDYFFPRNFSLLPVQTFYPQYYNPYVQRGQRYIPYTACGGAHPNGRAAAGEFVDAGLSGTCGRRTAPGFWPFADVLGGSRSPTRPLDRRGDRPLNTPHGVEALNTLRSVRSNASTGHFGVVTYASVLPCPEPPQGKRSGFLPRER